jgi:hypothetical protein
MIEQWREIAGFDGAYDVSDQGHVRRSPTEAGRGTSAKPGALLAVRLDRNGYPRVLLYDRTSRKYRNIGVHTAVLEAFVGERPEGTEASHRNGIRADARLENLCWETRSQNHRRKLDHGTLMWGERHPLAKLTEEKVIEIRRRAALGEAHERLARECGVARRTIASAVSGRTWPHCGQRPG